MTPERENKLRAVLAKRQPDVVVVLENVHDPHNIMAVSRSCDAIGIQTIYVVNNTKLEERQIKGSKSSASANKWIDFIHFNSIEVCYKQLKKDGFTIYCTHLTAKAQPLCSLDLSQKIALVFGNERDGLTATALELADGNFIIPQVGMIQSLNISVACAISVYEVFRQRQAKGFYEQQRISDETYNAIFAKWSKSKRHKDND